MSTIQATNSARFDGVQGYYNQAKTTVVNVANKVIAAVSTLLAAIRSHAAVWYASARANVTQGWAQVKATASNLYAQGAQLAKTNPKLFAVVAAVGAAATFLAVKLFSKSTAEKVVENPAAISGAADVANTQANKSLEDANEANQKAAADAANAARLAAAAGAQGGAVVDGEATATSAPAAGK